MTLVGSIEMWLNRDEGNRAWHLVNARILHDHHTQRMLFDPDLPLDDALHPLVAQCLTRALERQFETAVLSDRDLVLELGTLRLEGLRVLTRCPPDGTSTASVRFLNSVGDRDAILSDRMRPPRPELPEVDTLVAPVLQELLYPALEVFDHILQNGLSDENARTLAARVKTMRARRDELSDYIALLSKVVSDSRPPAPGGLPAKQLPAPFRADDHMASRSLRWSPEAGLSRGLDGGILHGHSMALDLKG